MSDGGIYKFKDVPLTSAIAEELIVELFLGATKERQEIADTVLRAHLDRGGLKPGADLTSVAKKALGDLRGSGLAENVSLGFWRILGKPPRAGQSSGDGVVPDLPEDQMDRDRAPSEQAAEQAADKIIGSGPSAVYVYYFPTYRLNAEDKSAKVWPCKIGRTDRDPLARILGQAATALPEVPHVALILRTSLPGVWESVLHGILTLKGCRMAKSPGTEWFLTSPDEIEGIIRAVEKLGAAFVQ